MKLNTTLKKSGKLWSSLADQIAQDKVAAALKKGARVLEPAIKRNAPTASGKMRSGVKTVVSNSGLSVRVISELGQEWYQIPVESGTKQGKLAIQPLARWAEAKLGKHGVEALQTAFAIATVKARKGGTKKTNWFYGPWDRLRSTINALYLGPVGVAIVEELDS